MSALDPVQNTDYLEKCYLEVAISEFFNSCRKKKFFSNHISLSIGFELAKGP
jgi:hypothetical protein